MKLYIFIGIIIFTGCSSENKMKCHETVNVQPDINCFQISNNKLKEFTDYSATLFKQDLINGNFKVYDTSEVSGLTVYSYVCTSFPTTFKIMVDNSNCYTTQFALANPMLAFEYYKLFIRTADICTKPTDLTVIFELSDTKVCQILSNVFKTNYYNGIKLTKEDTTRLLKIITEDYFQNRDSLDYKKIFSRKDFELFLIDSKLNKQQFTSEVLSRFFKIINDNKKSKYFCYYNIKTEALDLYILPEKLEGEIQRFFLPPLMFYMDEPFI
jgi:hypothetical protein